MTTAIIYNRKSKCNWFASYLDGLYQTNNPFIEIVLELWFLCKTYVSTMLNPRLLFHENIWTKFIFNKTLEFFRGLHYYSAILIYHILFYFILVVDKLSFFPYIFKGFPLTHTRFQNNNNKYKVLKREKKKESSKFDVIHNLLSVLVMCIIERGNFCGM